MSNRPKRPPIGGGASRNRTNRFSNDSNEDARSPNETGMLPFVPGGDLSPEESGSATEFFEISPSRNQNDQRGGPVNQQPAPPPNSNPVYRSDPYNQPNVHRPYQQPSFAPDNRIGAGDLDHSSNYQQPYMPPPPEQQSSGGSLTSYRVYAILITMFGVVLIAAVIAIYLIMNPTEKQGPEEGSTTRFVERSGGGNDISEEDEDNSSLESTSTPGKTKKNRWNGGKGKGGKSKGGGKEVTPVSSGGKLSVSVIGGTVVAVDLVCSGAKTRSNRSGSSFIFSGVTTRTCSLQFKPSGVTWKGKVGPGKISCKLIGGSQQVECQ